MSEEIDELAAALHAHREKSQHSSKKPWYRKRWAKISGSLVAIVLIATAVLLIFALINKPSQNQAALQKYAKSVSFPLYYPGNLPNFFLMDPGSIDASKGILIFTIDSGQQKIFVTEQSLPPGFNIGQISGKKVNLPNVGTVVIGTGFHGHRAVIQAKHTLIFVNGPSKINAADFSTVAKSFQPV